MTSSKLKLNILAAIAFSIASTAIASAPPKSIVQWHVKSQPTAAVAAGGRFDVTVSGNIDPGWHVYALEEPEDGPVATIVGLSEGDPANLLRVTEGTPKMVSDPIFQQSTGLFESTVDFTLHLQLAKGLGAGIHPLHVLIRFQSCDNHVCLAPHIDTVLVPLQTR
jgi:thiol:disulfide interchange protein DsbD